MKNAKGFEEWLYELFDGDEDEVVINFDDKELYKEFKEERGRE